MEAAYGDLEALNSRLMASLEETTMQMRALHGKVEEDQAEVEAEREKLTEALAELASVKEAHEAATASMQQRLDASQAEGEALRLRLSNLEVVSSQGAQSLKEVVMMEHQHQLEQADDDARILGEDSASSSGHPRYD